MVLAGTEVLHAKSGHVGRDRLNVLHPAGAEDKRGRRRDGEGHVGQLLLAEHGRDYDLTETEWLQHEVQRDYRLARDLHVGSTRGPSEARQRSGNRVTALGETGDGIPAIVPRDRAHGSTRGPVRDHDGGAGNRGALDVLHHSCNPTALGLSGRRDAVHSDHQHNERQEPTASIDHGAFPQKRA